MQRYQVLPIQFCTTASDQKVEVGVAWAVALPAGGFSASPRWIHWRTPRCPDSHSTCINKNCCEVSVWIRYTCTKLWRVQGFAESLQHSIKPQISVTYLFGSFPTLNLPYKEVTEFWGLIQCCKDSENPCNVSQDPLYSSHNLGKKKQTLLPWQCL